MTPNDVFVIAVVWGLGGLFYLIDRARKRHKASEAERAKSDLHR